jgi:hypothetical protein
MDVAARGPEKVQNLERRMTMKILGFIFLGVLAVIVLLTWSGYGGSTMDDYSSEKHEGQTLTVLADKTSVHTLVAGMFSKPEGYYFLRNSSAPIKGRYTRNQNTYNLKGTDGKEWRLTIQPDLSLRDEDGAVWLHKTHAESNVSMEKNRASCEENQGKDCPF